MLGPGLREFEHEHQQNIEAMKAMSAVALRKICDEGASQHREEEDALVSAAVQQDLHAQRKFNRLLQRLDHGMVAGAGFGLGAFTPAVQCGPLEIGAQRVLKHLRTGPQSKEVRSWIKGPDGRMKLEIRHEPSDTIHLVSDQGSVGFQGAQWVRSGLGLRCTTTFDPLHRCYNDIRGSMSSAGLAVTLLEETCLCSEAWPFQTAANPYHPLCHCCGVLQSRWQQG